MAGKTESYAFLERFREARNCHRVYERQGDPVMYACPFVQVGPGEGSDGLKRIEPAAAPSIAKLGFEFNVRRCCCK